MQIQRVGVKNPYVGSWLSYGGHRMYVGVFPSTHGQVLLATDKSSEAAGYCSAEACAASLMANGFTIDDQTWVVIAPMTGQLALF